MFVCVNIVLKHSWFLVQKRVYTKMYCVIVTIKSTVGYNGNWSLILPANPNMVMVWYPYAPCMEYLPTFTVPPKMTQSFFGNYSSTMEHLVYVLSIGVYVEYSDFESRHNSDVKFEPSSLGPWMLRMVLTIPWIVVYYYHVGPPK